MSTPAGLEHMIPFVLPPVIKNGCSMGRGRLFIVTVAVNTPATITHGLGRVPQIIHILDNGSGKLGERTIGSRTATQVTFTPTVALNNAVVWVI